MRIMFLPTLVIVYGILFFIIERCSKKRPQKDEAIAKQIPLTDDERKKQKEKEKDQADLYGCLVLLPFIILVIIFWNASTVTTVYKKDGEWKHKSGHYIGSYTGLDKNGDRRQFPVKTFGKEYIYNESGTELIIFNVGYGSQAKTPREEYSLPSREITEVRESPSYFFSYPMSIRSKSSGSVRWVVFEKSKYLERRRFGDL